MRRVLVTRPEPAATRTAARLEGAGFSPVKLPLFKNVPVPIEPEVLAGPYRAVVFTSANAAAEIPAAALTHLPAYAVGKATASAARRAGFSNVREGDGRAADLAEKIVADLGPAAREPGVDHPVLYLAGEPRHPELEKILGRAGVALDVQIAYRMEEISYSTDFVMASVTAPPVDAVLLYSVKGAERFVAILTGEIPAARLGGTSFHCMSRQVAGALPPAFRARAVIASAPSELHLVETLTARH